MRMNSELVIKIGDFEDYKREVHKYMHKAPPYRKILVLEPHKLLRLFTLERIRLLKTIREHPDYGAVKLANFLGRKQEAVSRDLSVLRGLGIVTDGEPVAIRRPISLNIIF